MISLNSTLRSSNPMVRVLDSGQRVLEYCVLPLEGEGGATQSFSSHLAWKHSPLASSLFVNEAGMLRKNKVMEVHNSILCYTVICQLVIS